MLTIVSVAAKLENVEHVSLSKQLPFHVGVVSRLATAIYVALVTPILYDNSSSLNHSNLKYESLMIFLKKSTIRRISFIFDI